MYEELEIKYQLFEILVFEIEVAALVYDDYSTDFLINFASHFLAELPDDLRCQPTTTSKVSISELSVKVLIWLERANADGTHATTSLSSRKEASDV